MPRKYRRYFLKEKEAKSILSQASKKLGSGIDQISKGKADMEVVESDFADIFLINGKPLLVRIEEKILPTLVSNEVFASMPKVIVDMGAVPYVCSGANVMAPGIVRFEGGFQKGDIVFVMDEKHRKTIAMGEAAYDVDDARKVAKGVVIKTIHFVGDKLWNSVKKLNNI